MLFYRTNDSKKPRGNVKHGVRSLLGIRTGTVIHTPDSRSFDPHPGASTKEGGVSSPLVLPRSRPTTSHSVRFLTDGRWMVVSDRKGAGSLDGRDSSGQVQFLVPGSRVVFESGWSPAVRRESTRPSQTTGVQKRRDSVPKGRTQKSQSDRSETSHGRWGWVLGVYRSPDVRGG